MHVNAKLMTAALVSLIAVGLGSSAHAAVLAQDTFDYPAGSLETNGSASDAGWEGAWVESGPAWQAVDVVGGSPLGAGNAIASYNVNGNLSGSSPASRDLTDIGVGAVGDPSLYFSFLVRMDDFDTTTAGSNNFNFRLVTSGGFSSPGLTINSSGVLSTTGNTNIGSSFNVNVATLAEGQTYLIVGRLQRKANFQHDFEVWVDPTTESDTSASAVIEVGQDSAVYTSVSVSLKHGEDGKVANLNNYFDSLVIGESFGDVIPEPASLALLGLGGVCIFGGRRRSA